MGNDSWIGRSVCSFKRTKPVVEVHSSDMPSNGLYVTTAPETMYKNYLLSFTFIYTFFYL